MRCMVIQACSFGSLAALSFVSVADFFDYLARYESPDPIIYWSASSYNTLPLNGLSWSESCSHQEPGHPSLM